MYRPSDLRKFLEEAGVKPKRGLSQNFLIDGNILDKITEAAELSKEDVVLEIGPGPGALTERLLRECKQVIAVELDRGLAEKLRRLDPSGEKLTILHEDILQVPFPERLDPLLQGATAKVVANLPYHITTPLLTKLLPMHTRFSHVIVMVQKEVAQRFTAKPGGKDYGSITLFLQFYSKPEYVFSVSRHCFYPQPKVDSAVVKFTLKKHDEEVDVEPFFTMVRESFTHRRKILPTSLKQLYNPEHVGAILEGMGRKRTCRPEQLSLEDFLFLFRQLQEKGEENNQRGKE